MLGWGAGEGRVAAAAGALRSISPLFPRTETRLEASLAARLPR